MKKLLMLLIAALVITGMQAQEPKVNKKNGPEKKMTPEEAAVKQSDQLEKKLLLDAKQKEYVKAAVKARMEKEKAIRDKYINEAERKAMHEELKAVHEAFRKDVNTKLNPQQQKKWAEMQEKHRKNMEERKKKGGTNEPPPPPAEGEE
jgi:hypothetical protein